MKKATKAPKQVKQGTKVGVNKVAKVSPTSFKKGGAKNKY